MRLLRRSTRAERIELLLRPLRALREGEGQLARARPGGMRRDAICIGEPGGDGERLERIGELGGEGLGERLLLGEPLPRTNPPRGAE